MDETRFLELVEARRKELGMSLPDVLEKAFANRTSSAIADIKRGRSPSLQKVTAICDALGLEFQIAPPRQPDSAPAVDPDHDLDYALISTYPLAASAGPGATAVDAIPDGTLAFKKEWLSRKGISQANAALLRARGDSMQPVIWDGDLLMLDLSRTTPGVSLSKTYGKSVYVVELDGSLLVKAITRPNKDRLHLVSENTVYPVIELRDEEINALRIIGKVVWWGHSAD